MTWLLCDYGNVLCVPPPPDAAAAVAAAAKWDPARGDFWKAYWDDRPAYDRADLTADEYWARVLGYALTPDHLQQLTTVDAASWVHPNRASVAAAGRAAKRGLRLAIFSNAPIEVAKAIDGAAWLASFPERFFSCYLHAVKPEARAYQAVLQLLGAQPDDVVFFDDRPVNVEAAARVGIDARVWTDPAQFDEVMPRR